MDAEVALAAARDTFARFVGRGLLREHARLYSQHNRLKSRQRGLRSWRSEESFKALQDAAALIQAAEVFRSLSPAEASNWQACLRRAGEILEWLSHGELESTVPIGLLSAAAYCLAGHPALSDALLQNVTDTRESGIIRALLRGDFPRMQILIRDYWNAQLNEPLDTGEPDISKLAVQEAIRALGVICAWYRWDDDNRLEVALGKLDQVARFYTTDRDPYSWLLAKLTSEVARDGVSHSWRQVLRPLATDATDGLANAIDRYCRSNFASRRAQAWPSQIEGVRRLQTGDSFAICTPTGSGKTSIAEVAILQGITTVQNFFGIDIAPLCLYLVPSRALAAEVEGKLSRVVRRVSSRRIVVTGLYGGTDWGPTDAWLTSDDPTVLICTYEKAEALIRFVGPLFLSRLTLVIFDEAHMVQFDGTTTALRTAESRSLRLESLGMRLRQLLQNQPCRMIALSAVAAGLEESLHRWVGGTEGSEPVLVSYRSTRQLVGRLECERNGAFAIHYDLMDGRPFALRGDPEDRPYIPNPIPPCPPGPSAWTGPEKSLRPACLWAAIQFALPDDSGRRHAVMISITQRITPFLQDVLELLDDVWSDDVVPRFFRPPREERASALWRRIGRVCQDYYGRDSYEYRLLKKGIVVHHSSVPKVLTRLIIDVVSSGICTIVIATSGLSEGINLPVETVLVPTVLRSGTTMPVTEFRNLAGRAGRPGVATEGRTLVMARPATRARDIARDRYFELLEDVQATTPQTPSSPLVNTIADIFSTWSTRIADPTPEGFLAWLETVTLWQLDETDAKVFGSLDALDSVLLSANVEGEEISNVRWEQRLQELWNCTFSVASADALWRDSFSRRGTAIPTLYGTQTERRRLYRTGLPPLTARQLLESFDRIVEVMKEGGSYGRASVEERLTYIANVVGEICKIERFRQSDDPEEWRPILRWWLNPQGESWPDARSIADRHQFINRHFNYRFAWGLGSVMGLLNHSLNEASLQPMRLEDWEQTGLPWVVFWLKELLSWGTHDPPAAICLAKGLL